jgi:hypothetical protein
MQHMSRHRAFLIQYCVTELPGAEAVNAAILRQFAAVRDDPGLERSHLFEGRYENLYIPRRRLPALAPVLAEAERVACHLLRCQAGELALGFWFNEMRPGHRTLAHRHDEDDELLSAVYYLSAPSDSGDLLLTQDAARTRIRPRQGMFVFFPPQVLHEVGVNHSAEVRLSIAMNFGIRRTKAPGRPDAEP